jgi:hypothetical protein
LVRELIEKFPGKCPLFLCLKGAEGDPVFIETHEKFFVCPSTQLEREANELFGPDTYYPKVDTSPPERVPRRWERRAEAPAE